MAADLAVRASACKAPIAASVFNWTGCYVGGKAGGLWSKSNFTTTMDL